MRTPLDFEGPQVLRWDDGHEEEIKGTYVTEGVLPKGSMSPPSRALPSPSPMTKSRHVSCLGGR